MNLLSRRRGRKLAALAAAAGLLVAAIAIIVPLYYLAKPGQPTPYDWFPYAALIVVVVAASYAYILPSPGPPTKPTVRPTRSPSRPGRTSRSRTARRGEPP